MKFHCDRCKTRYSISEERVRGKILKIRCKNCSAVITVREGMDQSGPAAPRSATAAAGAGLRSPTAAAGARSPAGTGLRSPAGTGKSPAAAPADRAAAKGAREPASRPGSVLEGAFAKALSAPREPDASESLSNAPTSLEAEWYVSVDGNQEGPLSLDQARRWISAKTVGVDVFCWSEGFDDWLPVDKVSHFRALRRAPTRTDSAFEDEERTVIDPSAARSPFAAQPPEPISVEETPRPLFAATMAQVEAEAPTVEENNQLPDPLRRGSPGNRRPSAAMPTSSRPGNGLGNGLANGASHGTSAPDDSDLEFDIGEASRVVQLPMLGRGPGGAAPGSGGLPGLSAQIGRGSGAESAIAGGNFGEAVAGDGARPEILRPNRRRGLLLPLVGAGVGLAVAIGLIVFFVSGSGDDGGGGDDYIARGSVGGGGNLGYTFRDEAKRAAEGEAVDEPDEEPGRTAPKRSNSTRVRPKTEVKESTPRTTSRSGPGEVDLSGGSRDAPSGPLDGDDLMDVYRANQYLVKRCYERALKKDPFLEASKIWVTISVSKAGSVSSVSIPNLRGSELGNCLTSIIKRWKFRRSTEVFNTRFPVVFGN